MLQKQKWFLFTLCAVVLCIFFSPSKTFAETAVSTDINTDTTWSVDASPYIVSRNLTIGSTATLTIEPGVQVLVDPNAQITIDGKIVAHGTNDTPIYFDVSTADTVWGGFVFDTLGEVDFDFVHIAHTDTAISADDADIAVSHTIFSNVQNPADITMATRFTHSDNSFVHTEVQGWNIQGGTTIGDSTLVAGDGIYNISGATAVDIGDTLSIDPGVILQFAAYAELLVFGNIHAIGNADALIEMIGVSEYEIFISGAIAAFAYIHVGTGGYIDTSNSTVTFVQGSIDTSRNECIAGYASTLTIADSTFSHCGTGIFIAHATTLSLEKSSIKNISTGISAFTENTVSIEHMTIDTVSQYGISFGDRTKIHMINSEIKNGNIGVSFYDHSILDVSNSKIHDLQQGIVLNGQDQVDAKILINGAEIYNTTDYALRIFDITENADIHRNSIHDTNGKNVLYIGDGLDISRNWWGSKEGPDPESMAPDVSLISYTPWLRRDPTKPGRVPVIIIPGITGTRLLKAYDTNEELWPDLSRLLFDPFDYFLNALSLQSDGTEYLDKHIISGDILRGVHEYGANTDVFETLISDLETKDGYIEGTDLFVFPYDWRFDSKTSADKLKEKIDQVLQDTGYDKVDIIAHSMGGLVTKRYIAENDDSKIDKLFFVGTPHLGAPKAFKALMYGDNMGYQVGNGIFKVNLLTLSKLKEISQNMPSSYELLPSEDFGKYVQYKGKDLDYTDTEKLMINEGRNAAMLPFVHTLHSVVDTPPIYTSAKVYDFAGCSTKTIGEFNITKYPIIHTDKVSLLYTQGDETVPLKSADAISQGEHYYSKLGTHAELPSIAGIRTAIANIIAGKAVVSDDTFSDTKNICAQSGKSIEIHSPVTLDIYDDQGRHTGPTSDGSIEYNIPNVSYNTIDDQKFAYLPDGPNYRVVQHAEHTGTYDMYIHSISTDDSITSSAYFTSLPISTDKMSGELSITPTSTIYTVSLDQDGDGVPDASIASKDTLEVPATTNTSTRSSGGRAILEQKQDAVVSVITKVSTENTQEKIIPIQKDTPKIVHKKVRSQRAGIGEKNSENQQGDTEKPAIQKSITQRWYVRLQNLIKKLFIR